MNKNIYALMLTAPLLFTACTTSSILPTVENKTEEKITTAETTLETTTPTELTVNFIKSEDIKKSGMLHIKSFMGTLKPTLKSLIQSDKTFKTAMGGCTSMAMKMTDDYNNISETKIRRTALKYRNPLNAPDATDTKVMERFLASQNFNEPLVVEMPNNYRVYKALDMKKPCLACHGTNISKDLTEMLLKTYPTDLATNFQLGEFRGVVVAEVQK